jgi:hypothetical protein
LVPVPRLASLLYGAARGGALPQNGRRPRSGRVSDRETDPEIIPRDHIPTLFCRYQYIEFFLNEILSLALSMTIIHPKNQIMN